MDGRNHVSAVELRESGKVLIKSSIPEERSAGIQNIIKAYEQDDPEAAYLVGKLLLDGKLRCVNADSERSAIKALHFAASNGDIQARAFLDSFLRDKNKLRPTQRSASQNHALTDFDGKRIRINRKGLLTPVDVTLSYTDGHNILDISANLYFAGDEGLPNRARYLQAVVNGIKLWQGQYSVFGDQPVKVNVHLSTEQRMVDSIIINTVRDSVLETVKGVVDKIGSEKIQANYSSMAFDRRSVTSVIGHRWTARAPKFISIISEDDRFDDYDEIMHVAKHEFGHVLGLGDLYEDDSDRLSGVEEGTFPELDGFLITDKFYYQVMCDHHAPISNNDIEMVILAFSRNKAQLFQKGNMKGEISKALGKGN